MFKDFLANKITPLANNSTYELFKTEMKNDKELQNFIKNNNNLTNLFYDCQYSMFNLTPREAITLFADIPVSEYNLRKFYSLSKSLVIFEQDSQQYQ